MKRILSILAAIACFAFVVGCSKNGPYENFPKADSLYQTIWEGNIYDKQIVLHFKTDSYGICYYRIHPDDDYIQSIDFNYRVTGNLFVLSNKDNNWPIRIFGDWLIDDFTDNSISLSMYDGKEKVHLNLSKTDMLPEL